MADSDTPDAAAAYPFIGSRISLITRSDIRYEGTLFTIDPGNSTVALSNVRCFGTEDRRPDTLPPSDAVFPFIIFKGADIKNLIVCAEQDEPSEQLPSPPDDPAIVSTSVPSPNSAVLAAANLKQQAQTEQVESKEQPLVIQMQNMSMNHSVYSPSRSVSTYSPVPPAAFNAYGSGYQPQGMWYSPRSSPDTAFAAHTASNPSPAMYPPSAYAPPYYRPQMPPNMQPQYYAQPPSDMLPQHYPPPPNLNLQQHTQPAPKIESEEHHQPPPNMQAQYRSQPPMSMQHLHYSTTVRQKSPSSTQEPLQSMPLPGIATTNKLKSLKDISFPRSQRGPRPSHHDERQSKNAMRPRSSHRADVDNTCPDSEFDFQSSNARFDKASFARSLMSPQSNVSERSYERNGDVSAAAFITEPQLPKYNKAASFFDDISLDRDERGRRDNSRRGQNQETFGKLAANYMVQNYQRSKGRTRRGHQNQAPNVDVRGDSNQRISRSMQAETPSTAIRRSDNRPLRIDGNPRSDGRRYRLRRGRNQSSLTNGGDNPNMGGNVANARPTTRQWANGSSAEINPPVSPSHRSKP